MDYAQIVLPIPNIYVNNVYLVSNIGHVAIYDFNKNLWQTIYHEYQSNNSNSDMRFNKKPIIWTYQYMPNMLHCATAKYNKKLVKYEFKCRCFDLRTNKRKWRKSMPYLEKQTKTLVDFNYLFR